MHTLCDSSHAIKTFICSPPLSFSFNLFHLHPVLRAPILQVFDFRRTICIGRNYKRILLRLSFPHTPLSFPRIHVYLLLLSLSSPFKRASPVCPFHFVGGDSAPQIRSVQFAPFYFLACLVTSQLPYNPH